MATINKPHLFWCERQLDAGDWVYWNPTPKQRDAVYNEARYHTTDLGKALINADAVLSVYELCYINVLSRDVRSQPEPVIEAMAAFCGFTLRITRYRDKMWREREACRLSSCEYRPLPSAWKDLEPIPDHFAHVSMDGASIAYTPNEAKGEIDVQVVAKPGRYLAKFYPDLSSDEVRELAGKVQELKLGFATTPEDIVELYLNGPSSCMSKSHCEYDSNVHPVSVYGDSDLQVAYLGDLDHALARAVVNPARMRYPRIYASYSAMVTMMRDALREAGYAESGNALLGAKLRRIEQGSQFVMPYLDGDYQGLHDYGDHFVISDTGKYQADSTSGLMGSCSYCERCEEPVESDCDLYTVTDRHGDDHQWCEYCRDEYAFYCNGHDRYYHDRVPHVHVGDWTYCQEYFDENGGYYCERTDTAYFSEDEEPVVLADTNETVCMSWAQRNAWGPMDDGQYYAEDPEGNLKLSMLHSEDQLELVP